MRIAVATAMLLCVLMALGACGKRGAPLPPGPAAEVIYPRSYPTR